jgi:hypothetical protein
MAISRPAQSFYKVSEKKGLQFSSNHYKILLLRNGEVSERFKEHAWKACVLETVPWVRIPPSPFFLFLMDYKIKHKTTLNTSNHWSGNLTIRNCEPCQGRKAAAISRPSYVFRISRASLFAEVNNRQCILP